MKLCNKFFKVIIGLLLLQQAGYAQDFQFADVQNMNILNNQALKMNGRIDFRVANRDVRYQSLSAFRTTAGVVNVPLRFGEGDGEGRDQSFLTATLGGMFDKSNKGVFKNNTGVFGLSYAQKLSDANLFLSAGFQGAFSRSTIGGSSFIYPDQFNQYGQLPSQTADPLGAGRSYNWTSLNAGLSLFQNEAERQWYVGASVRHINKPFTDELKTEAFRVQPTVGLQAGLNMVGSDGEFSVFGLANWKAKAYEYVFGGRIIKNVQTNSYGENKLAIGAGLSMRWKDALMPNLLLRYDKTNVAFFYDVNIGGIRAAGFRRQGFEISLKQTF
jgi:hypothetical protein